jgi:hypothetical protein
MLKQLSSVLVSFIIVAVSCSMLAASAHAQRGSPSASPSSSPDSGSCVADSDASGSYCNNKGCSGTCNPSWERVRKGEPAPEFPGSGPNSGKKLARCECKDCDGCTYSVSGGKASCSGSCTVKKFSGGISIGIGGVKGPIEEVPGTCHAVDSDKDNAAGRTGCVCQAGPSAPGRPKRPIRIGPAFGQVSPSPSTSASPSDTEMPS